MPLADDWVLYDNSFGLPMKVAEKNAGQEQKILHEDSWQQFRGSK